jgi:starch synthase (maltosyl-transferring)
VEVRADIFSDGHEVIAADLLYRVVDENEWCRSPMRFYDNDRWIGQFIPSRHARYLFTIEAWRDPFATWAQDTRKRIAAGQDFESGIAVGRRLVEESLPGVIEAKSHANSDARGALSEVEELLSEKIVAAMYRGGPRHDLSCYPQVLEIAVERKTAVFSSWYELFPRSQSGDPSRHGTFDDVIGRLSYIHDLGFDVLYLPPIHPIGTK